MLILGITAAVIAALVALMRYNERRLWTYTLMLAQEDDPPQEALDYLGRGDRLCGVEARDPD